MTTILLVDDIQFERKILSKAINHKLECTILEAENSLECFDILKSNSIDLVLLDIELPEINGIEILQKIRELKNSIALPIIMVSGMEQDKHIGQCLQLGANDYISKPINYEITFNRIKNQLEYSKAIRKEITHQELLTLKSIIVTYNHELNTPLTSALLQLEKLKSVPENEHLRLTLDKLTQSLEKIHLVVKKIDKLTSLQEINYDNYSNEESRIKL